jgi:hypothetical protein
MGDDQPAVLTLLPFAHRLHKGADGFPKIGCGNAGRHPEAVIQSEIAAKIERRQCSTRVATVDQIERVACTLCVAAGENPDRRLQDYGRTAFSFLAWEDFRDKARRQLETKGPPDGGKH